MLHSENKGLCLSGHWSGATVWEVTPAVGEQQNESLFWKNIFPKCLLCIYFLSLYTILLPIWNVSGDIRSEYNGSLSALTFNSKCLLNTLKKIFSEIQDCLYISLFPPISLSCQSDSIQQQPQFFLSAILIWCDVILLWVITTWNCLAKPLFRVIYFGL